MKRKFFLIVSWALVIAAMGIIFFFSSQVSEDSSEMSERTLNLVIDIIRPFIDDISETNRPDIKDSVHIMLRKAAHATIYMILALLLSNAFYVQNYFFRREKAEVKGKKLYKNSVWAFCVSVAYAVSDELHQLFVPGRSCEVRDMLIDASGAVAGVFIYILLFNVVVNAGKKRKQTG